MPPDTEAVLNHHLRSFDEGIDSILKDYTEGSVVVTPEATFRGINEIRGFFESFVAGLPAGIWNSFTMRRQVVVGEVAYILWEAKPWFPLGTDTFVVKEGKIAFQTFASYSAPR